MDLKKHKTQRGFEIIEFSDYYNCPCNIQESSIATENAIWFGVDDPNPKILWKDALKLGIETDIRKGWIKYQIPEEVLINTRMHLTQDQVKELLPILQKFAEDGEI